MSEARTGGHGVARVLRIDGLAVRTTLDLAGVPRTSRPADWDLRITDSPFLLDDDATEWTGDIRDYAAGFAVLADDHVVVEAHGPDQVAHASFPFVEADGTACAVLRPERMPHEDKAPLPLLTPRPAAPQPVVCVAFLERGAELAVEPLPSAEAARRLLRDVLFVADPGSPSENAGRLDGAIALARDLPTIRLTLPDGLQRLASGLSALPALLPAR